MIIAGVLNLILVLFKIVFGLLPGLPTISFLINILTFFNNTICKGLEFFCFFIRPSTVITGLTVAVAMFAFHHFFGFTMWVLKKIPFLNIK